MAVLWLLVASSLWAGFSWQGGTGGNAPTPEQRAMIQESIDRLLEIASEMDDSKKRVQTTAVAIGLNRALREGRINIAAPGTMRVLPVTNNRYESRLQGAATLCDTWPGSFGDRIVVSPVFFQPADWPYQQDDLTMALTYAGTMMFEVGDGGYGFNLAETQSRGAQVNVVDHLYTGNQYEQGRARLDAREASDMAQSLLAGPSSQFELLAPGQSQAPENQAEALGRSDDATTVIFKLVNLPPSGRSVVEAIRATAPAGTPWTSFDFGFDQPTGIAVGFDASGARILLVGGTDAGLTQGGLGMMTDTDNDGMPDPASLTTLVAAGGFRIPRDLLLHEGSLYILDRDDASTETSRIHVMRDTDADGAPDSAPEVFADVAACPGVAEALAIGLFDEGPPAVIEIAPGPQYLGGRGFTQTVWLLTDNGGGRAATVEESAGYRIARDLEPDALHEPVAGDTEVTITGTWNSEIELHEVDASGRTTRQLGSVTITSSSLTATLPVPPEDAFTTGQMLQLVDTTRGIDGVAFHVAGTTSQVHYVAPPSVYAEDWVTIHGRGFESAGFFNVTVNGQGVTSKSLTDTTLRFSMPYLFEPAESDNRVHPLEIFCGQSFDGQLAIEYLGKRPGNNAWPFADAGRQQTVRASDTVRLDGTGSYDDDGDPLTYEWTPLVFPQPVLSDPTSPSPTFEAPVPVGDVKWLLFQLVVSDGQTRVGDIVPINVLKYEHGDIDRDGDVDADDAQALLEALLGRRTFEATDAVYADINRDNRVNIADLVTMTLTIAGR